MERLYLTARAARGRNAQAIVQAISDCIHDHTGDTPQFDDVTLVVLKREWEITKGNKKTAG
jgi:serine phosphatase RsbU (regulator of sigma subunit)